MKCLSSMMRTLVAGGVFLGVCAYGACGSGGGSGSQTGGQGGASFPNTATGGSTGGLGGAAATGGSAGGQGGAVGTGGSAAGSGGASLAGGAGGSGGGSGGSTFPNVGVCGESGDAVADATSYDGHEVRYILGNEDYYSTRICQVQFDLKRVGDAPPGCTVCTWTHLLEYSNPSAITDTDGVCAQSDLALDPAAIAKIVGSRVAIGLAEHYGGAHATARMTYFEATNTWDVVGNANWDETTKAFKYDFRDGFCNYGP